MRRRQTTPARRGASLLWIDLLRDVLALVVAGAAVTVGTRAPHAALAAIAFSVVVLGLQFARRGYVADLRPPLGGELAAAWTTCAVAAMSVTTVAVLVGAGVSIAEPMGWLWLIGAGLLSLGRASACLARSELRRHGGRSSPTLIVGAGRIGHLAARRLEERPHLGLRPIGFLDRDPLDGPDRPMDLPVLGASWDLEKVVAEHCVEHAVIAFSTAPTDVLLSIVRRCERLGVTVSVVPRLFEVDGELAVTSHIGALPLQRLRFSDPDARQLRAKYALERSIALLMLLVMLPLLVVIAAAIWLTTGRPLLYRQQRVGRGDEPFWMYKFRTMRGDPDRDGEADVDWAVKMRDGVSDPEGGRVKRPEDRTTSVGRVLRRYSLDELPQLWNIVRGEMALIGPRPERLSYVEYFGPAIYRYSERHRVKPGLTGWAQVQGLRGKTSLADRVEWDNFYVENWSWRLDLKILALTFTAMRTSEEADRGEAGGASAQRSRARLQAPLRLTSRLTRRIISTFVIVAVLAIMIAPPSVAAAPPSAVGPSVGNGPSAVDQYVEQLPTSTGPHAIRGANGKGAGHVSPRAAAALLGPAVMSRLQALGGPQRAQLEAIATSPALGAPQGTRPGASGARTPVKVKVKAPGLPASAASAVSHGGDQLLWLVIVLAAVSAAAVGAALHQRSSRRNDG